MAKTPEGRITANTLFALKKHGGVWFKVHGSAFQRAGIPDIVGCYRGRFVAFEVKTPKTIHDVSPMQKVTLRRIARAGGIQRIIVSAMEATEVLESIDRALDREES